MLKEELGVDAELKIGKPGSFEVSVNGAVVAKKHLFSFPSEEEIVSAVGQALQR